MSRNERIRGSRPSTFRRASLGGKTQSRNLKLYELGNDFIPKYLKGFTEKEINGFVLYLVDNLELLCGSNGPRVFDIKKVLIRYFNHLNKGGLKIYILYNEDELYKKRNIQDNIKAFAVVSEHFTKGEAHQICGFSGEPEDTPINLSGAINCFRSGYFIEPNEEFKPYIHIHYLCAMAPMIMPDVTSSYRRIERENSLKPVSTFFRRMFTTKRSSVKKTQKRVRKLTKIQRDSIQKLPRDKLFKGSGRELLNELENIYNDYGVELLYLDAIMEPKVRSFYKSHGFKILYRPDKKTVIKSFNDTVSMVKLISGDCNKHKKRSSIKQSKSKKALTI